jgi:uncharacterized glyoxalase superfamily protein PhnB
MATKSSNKPARRARPAARKPQRVKRRQPETLRLRTASPGFTVNDLQKSLAWYRDVVGFTVGELWREGDQVVGAELKAGGIFFMIGQDDWMKGRDRKKGEGFRMYCTTAQDVDALAAAIKARGGVLDHEPQDQPWGVRDFGITDPDGFKITIQAPIRTRR